MPDLTIQVQEIRGLAGTALVVLNGSIDAKTVITFQTHLNSVKERGINRFILDMENVKYVNSTGLGYLINLSDSVGGDKGGIALVKVQPKVKVVFDMLGLNAFFKIYQNRDEALRQFSSDPMASSTDQTVVLGGAGSRPAPGGSPGKAAATAVLEPVASKPAPVHERPMAQPPAHPPAQPAAAGETQIECKTCHSPLALREVGTYKCPRCFTLFNYVGGGKASFLPRRKEMPVQLSLNFSDECTQGLVEFVRLVANRAGFVDGVLGDLTGAVKRAVEALRDHAYGGNPNNLYHVMLVPGEAELEVRFADYGNSISADKPGADGRPVFAAVKAAVDKFDLKNHPKGGNIVTLSKRAKSS